jgi:hypothetical protein
MLLRHGMRYYFFVGVVFLSQILTVMGRQIASISVR